LTDEANGCATDAADDLGCANGCDDLGCAIAFCAKQKVDSAYAMHFLKQGLTVLSTRNTAYLRRRSRLRRGERLLERLRERERERKRDRDLQNGINLIYWHSLVKQHCSTTISDISSKHTWHYLLLDWGCELVMRIGCDSSRAMKTGSVAPTNACRLAAHFASLCPTFCLGSPRE
jgi:hypothetical protein